MGGWMSFTTYLLDVLLTAAERGLCHVRWSAESLAELEEHYVIIRTGRSDVSKEVARAQMGFLRKSGDEE
jgi:hypothetical protein